MPLYKMTEKRLTKKAKEDEEGVTELKATIGLASGSSSGSGSGSDSEGSSSSDGDKDEDDEEGQMDSEDGKYSL